MAESGGAGGALKMGVRCTVNAPEAFVVHLEPVFGAEARRLARV